MGNYVFLGLLILGVVVSLFKVKYKWVVVSLFKVNEWLVLKILYFFIL